MFWGSELALLVSGLDHNDWMQLWSGVLGAVLSAAVAAGVAAGVLVRSNAHQRDLSGVTLGVQRELAEKQLSDQRLAAEKQLLEQRELADKQLSEQRRATDIARERAAIADAVVGAERFREFYMEYRDPVAEVQRHIPAFSSAIVRWRLELLGNPMEYEVERWHGCVLVAAGVRADEKRKGDLGEEARASIALHLAIDSLNAIAFHRQRSDADDMTELRDRLERARVEFVAFQESRSGV